MWDRGRRFSASKGLVSKTIQTDALDVPTTNLLWNEISIYLKRVIIVTRSANISEHFLHWFWVEYYREPLDTLYPSVIKTGMRNQAAHDNQFDFIYGCLNNSFSTQSDLNQKFNILQHVLDFDPPFPEYRKNEIGIFVGNRLILISMINQRFEQCFVAYRIVNETITPNINPIEIAAIETASSGSDNLKNVNTHINNSLRLMSQRPIPDYVNSGKESISAVECICRIVANLPDKTLSQALEPVAKMLVLDEGLVKSIKELYWYTCNAEGMRHSLKETDTGYFGAADAMHLLVTCSAIVNLIVDKAQKAGKL